MIRSAASRTLVGTRFSLIAPPTDEADVEDESSLDCDLGALNAEESDSAAQGDGKGFRGEIIEAEVDKDGIWAALIEVRGPPTIGILRESPEGLRNSLGRRCRGGL